MKFIEVRGARVHNLKNIDVDVPLNKIVGIAGVSGSGKSSLALGVLYAEGSGRYLESLSAYTRRRMTEAARPDVDEVRFVPAALALRQRPGVGGIRSTFGTATELGNSLRLMFSRLASHRSPGGIYLPPTILVAEGKPLKCPVTGEEFYPPSAEELSFNSGGACPTCSGTGIVRSVDEATLVPDESLSIEEGAVAPWNSLMWSLMVDVAREMGVRTNIPFCELTPEEREIVFHGAPEKKHILYKAKSSDQVAELDFTYYSAVRTVENALSKVKDETGMKRVEKFLKETNCPDCMGSRLSEAARAPKINGLGLDDVSRMSLKELTAWVKSVPETLPEEMRPMAEKIVKSFLSAAGRLSELGLDYLSVDRSAVTLSTGERQRMQLARAVRNRTTGVLYVLDEPSIGLHPKNIEGLKRVMRELVADGNSVILVDHDTEILSAADEIIEMGPGAGRNGGTVMARGSAPELSLDPVSKIGKYLNFHKNPLLRQQISAEKMFELGAIRLQTDAVHTVKPLSVEIPKGRLTVITGVSGSGKTTLILESLVPALQALTEGKKLPRHVKSVSADGIKKVRLIDAQPIGINVRSTVATYAGVHDELRKVFAKVPLAREKRLKAGDFSYNTGRLRCPTCDGTGTISLDVQFLPDVEIDCPDCRGRRYAAEVDQFKITCAGKARSLPELMAMAVTEACEELRGIKSVAGKLKTLVDLGLGYLTLGEATPGLSGGEAQRLKLAGETGKGQSDAVFVFDEPTIGLHPDDVGTLMAVIERLLNEGATVIVIEHDLTVIENADFIIDMGPGGGEDGGRVVFSGTPEELARCRESATAPYLKGLGKIG